MKVECGFPGYPMQLEALGPRLGVQIGFDLTFRPNQGAEPDIPEQLLSALVDTGASRCFIDMDVALAHRLPIVDREDVVGAFGASEVNVYLGQLRVPSLSFTVYGQFAGADLTGLGCAALIGRAPILSRYEMNYVGATGSVTLER